MERKSGALPHAKAPAPMHLTEPNPSSSSTTASLRGLLTAAKLGRFVQGLFAVGLVEDLHAGGPFTLLAPADDAYDALPWKFDEFLLNPDIVEARFDILEYHVIRGVARADGPRQPYTTLHGESVRLGRQLALGKFGASRILRSIESGDFVVHVLEHCLFPTFPRLYAAKADSNR